MLNHVRNLCKHPQHPHTHTVKTISKDFASYFETAWKHQPDCLATNFICLASIAFGIVVVSIMCFQRLWACSKHADSWLMPCSSASRAFNTEFARTACLTASLTAASPSTAAAPAASNSRSACCSNLGGQTLIRARSSKSLFSGPQCILVGSPGTTRSRWRCVRINQQLTLTWHGPSI